MSTGLYDKEIGLTLSRIEALLKRILIALEKKPALTTQAEEKGDE